jgi:hypothetical protein
MSLNGMNESERTFLVMIDHLMGPNKKSASGKPPAHTPSMVLEI